MTLNPKFKCEGCVKPVSRRLALFLPKDEYECYAESYIKCFWSLCDQQKSNHAFFENAETKVVTEQPRPQKSLINQIIINEYCMKKLNA